MQLTLPEGPSLLKNQLRSNFAFSGKIDSLTSDSKPIGIVTRRLEILDPDEKPLLHLQDPSSWKENLAESLVDALGNALLSGDNTSGSSSRSKYLLVCENSPCGTLTRERLPFFPEPPREPGAIKKFAAKLLPKHFAKRQPPLAWHLNYDLPEYLQIPDYTLINSITMLIELLRWIR